MKSVNLQKIHTPPFCNDSVISVSKNFAYGKKNKKKWTYLSWLSHLSEATNRVEGSGSADQQMGLVVLLQDLDVVSALWLLEEVQIN